MTANSGRRPLHVVPINRRDAREFVGLWHRHLPKVPVTWLYQLGVARDDTLVGVAIVGTPQPLAIASSEPLTVQIYRTAVADDEPHVASMLNGAAWRAAKALGYTRLITYTEAGEPGTSLRAAGFRVVAERRPRGGWDTPKRRRVPHGREHIARTLWEAS